MTTQPATSTCYRHPDREATIRCQRCDRPVCPDCMRDAPVGFQCPECAGRNQPQVQGAYGGRRSTEPRATSIVLIVINVVVWGAIYARGRMMSHLTSLLALTPSGQCVVAGDPGRYFPGSTTRALCGGGTWHPGQASGMPWQVLTNAFTHVEPLHLAFNMIALWMLGPALEQVLGRARFLAVYLGSALTASALIMWASDPTTSTVGASGAVFGLMATYLVLALKLRAPLQGPLTWIGANALITFLPGTGISWQGHVGGFLGGLALAAVIIYAPRAWRGTRQWALVAAIVVAALALIALRMVALAA